MNLVRSSQHPNFLKVVGCKSQPKKYLVLIPESIKLTLKQTNNNGIFWFEWSKCQVSSVIIIVDLNPPNPGLKILWSQGIDFLIKKFKSFYWLGFHI